jgi:hypothetical protein
MKCRLVKDDLLTDIYLDLVIDDNLSVEAYNTSYLVGVDENGFTYLIIKNKNDVICLNINEVSDNTLNDDLNNLIKTVKRNVKIDKILK